MYGPGLVWAVVAAGSVPCVRSGHGDVLPTRSQASLSSIPADSIGVGLAVRSHCKKSVGKAAEAKMPWWSF